MVTASSTGRRTSDAELEILATARKRRRREVAMHPLPLPRPQPGPLPVSASKTVASSRHRHHHQQQQQQQQQQHQHQSKAAVVSRGWKIRCSSSAGLLQRHTHSRPALQPGSRSGAGGPSAADKTPSATASSERADEHKKEGKVTRLNMGRSDKVIVPHSPFMYSVIKAEEYCQPLSTKKRNKRNLQLRKTSIKRNENNHSQNAPSVERCNILKKEGGKPIISGSPSKNLKLLKVGLKSVLSLQGDQNYAGPKFSEPPSPSVLPKPPSHWVGAHAEYPDKNSTQMHPSFSPQLLHVVRVNFNHSLGRGLDMIVWGLWIKRISIPMLSGLILVNWQQRH
ncbi:proline-rich nuclear receptor coactivator 1-like isoform X2 [Carcharodon carcharias]|uniref:proline-rich nuclear receptor coactivator 1-like isoform X2 n=1 Tax=Carcharodon carcharias TaxID=13397 RepID=UPI001B7DE6A4|nr:proline-rich nuclear receptor coactivator 1-like isoform X2 [Carcharodon carcharias]